MRNTFLVTYDICHDPPRQGSQDDARIRHIANAPVRNRMADVCAASGFEVPVICTPEELLED